MPRLAACSSRWESARRITVTPPTRLTSVPPLRSLLGSRFPLFRSAPLPLHQLYPPLRSPLPPERTWHALPPPTARAIHICTRTGRTAPLPRLHWDCVPATECARSTDRWHQPAPKRQMTLIPTQSDPDPEPRAPPLALELPLGVTRCAGTSAVPAYRMGSTHARGRSCRALTARRGRTACATSCTSGPPPHDGMDGWIRPLPARSCVRSSQRANLRGRK